MSSPTPSQTGNVRLTSFFEGDNAEFGVFYPKDHVLAVFPTLEEAEKAKTDLRNGGAAEDSVIAAPGEEVVAFAEEHFFKDGVLGTVMTKLSRAIGTEADYADKDLAFAKAGNAFVAVRCANEEAKNAMWALLAARSPIAARYYTSGGIEHLAGEH